MPTSHAVSLALAMFACSDSALPLISCTWVTANIVYLHLLVPALAQGCFFGASCLTELHVLWHNKVGVLSRENLPLQQLY